MYLGSSYDSWRLDNDEQTSFTCPECGHLKDIEEVAHNDEMCSECLAQKVRDEFYLYGEVL